MIGPVVEEISQEYEGKAIVGKMDVDQNSEVPVQFGIRTIPTLLFFKNGNLVDRQVGVVSKNALLQKLDALI